jgi:hypothetical protein
MVSPGLPRGKAVPDHFVAQPGARLRLEQACTVRRVGAFPYVMRDDYYPPVPRRLVRPLARALTGGEPSVDGIEARLAHMPGR